MHNKTATDVIDHTHEHLVKRFMSRQNDVALMLSDNDELRVKKSFTLQDHLNRELAIHGQLEAAGWPVPGLLGRNTTELYYEYLNGPTLYDILTAYEAGEDPLHITAQILQQLLDWLTGFHRITGKIFFDINLKNFIRVGTAVYGVDYEDAREGRPETDIGRLLAFILTYEPVFTRKKYMLARELYRTAATQRMWDVKAIGEEMIQELAMMEKRRGLSLSGSADDILSSVTSEVEP